jgi:hypothetical protein
MRPPAQLGEALVRAVKRREEGQRVADVNDERQLQSPAAAKASASRS